MQSYHFLNNDPFMYSKRLLSDCYVSVAGLGAGDIVVNNIKIKNMPCSYQDNIYGARESRLIN